MPLESPKSARAPGENMATHLESDEQLLQQQRLEAINCLAPGVAHEFNNVLQVVRGYVTFARDALPEGSEPREDLNNALAATTRAADLASRLLQFARAEDDEAILSDASDALDSLRLLLKPVIGENIKIETDIDDDLPSVPVGDASLRQALLNLCLNARDAMPEGGVLTLKAKQLQGRSGIEAAIGTHPDGPSVCLSVEDTGEGMSEETKANIFEPLFTTKGAAEGTGLGLPMVAALALRAGGGVLVDSEVGGGTRFDLLLPVVDEPLGDNAAMLTNWGLESTTPVDGATS